MTPASNHTVQTVRHRWPVREATPALLAYLLPVELLAVVMSLGFLLLDVGDGANWTSAALLVALALAFDEISRRSARLRIRLSSQMRTDMTSVWAIAASVALPRGVTVVLMIAIFSYDWLRHHRPAGEALYRKLFTLSTVLLGCAAAGKASAVGSSGLFGTDAVSSRTSAILLAILAYAIVQRALVTVGVMFMGVRGRILLGSRDDNLIEFATLCLGGLVALALTYEPWLAVLALTPMVTLHRGALLRELETAASVDAKTGVLNAVAWEQLAQRELARAKREQRPLSILIIDVDHFKRVNDRFGHLVGDMVLRGLCKTLTASMREYDTVGRFGGEEFVAVLPGIDTDAAVVIAERMRAQINRTWVSQLADGRLLAEDALLAVSIGVASTRGEDVEVTDLLHWADQALYRAKALGRNQVQIGELGDDGVPERVAQL